MQPANRRGYCWSHYAPAILSNMRRRERGMYETSEVSEGDISSSMPSTPRTPRSPALPDSAWRGSATFGFESETIFSDDDEQEPAGKAEPVEWPPALLGHAT